MMTEMTLDLAVKLAQAARERASAFGASITVSIVDRSGRLVLTHRGDGTGFLTTETSKAKALASAAFHKSTKDLVDLQKTNPAFWNALSGAVNENILPTTGGVPIMIDGVLIGAIGCGGGSPDQDHECAMAATHNILAEPVLKECG